MHKLLFASELFRTEKEVGSDCMSITVPYNTYCGRKFISNTQFLGKILYEASNLEKMLEKNYIFIHESVSKLKLRYSSRGIFYSLKM